MLISGELDKVSCKMFVSTLAGMALDWFSRLPNRVISSFDEFVKLFMA